MVERVAQTLYETDEDILDEAISRMIAAGQRWSEADHPRMSWKNLEEVIREGYRRRSRAAIAAAEIHLGLTTII